MTSPESLISKNKNLINVILKNWDNLDESQKSVLTKIWNVLTYKWQLQILINVPFLIYWLLDKNVDSISLTLSEEDALKAQIFSCWSIPLGLPYNENLLVKIKLELKPDGTVIKSEILDHARMNKPGQGFYKVLAESALRAIKLCQPLRVPAKGYERWKNLQLNFDAREMLEG